MTGYTAEAVDGQYALSGHPAALVARPDKQKWLADPSCKNNEALSSIKLVFDHPTNITSIEICLLLPLSAAHHSS